MSNVIVAGSLLEFNFSVVDFTNPSAPFVALVDPGPSFAGCVVAISDDKVVAADALGGDVRMVDISNPHAPVLKGKASTTFSGIASVSMHGSLVAIGESQNSFQARVALLDFSNPMSPIIVGDAHTTLALGPNPAISCVAFISDTIVIASGNDPQMVQVDFSTSSPTTTNVPPPVAGSPTIDADSDANVLVAGDSSSGILKIFNANTKALIGQLNTSLSGIGSVAVANPQVLCGGPSDLQAILVHISGSPSARTVHPNVGGGCVTAITDQFGACGDIVGTPKSLSLISAPPARLACLRTLL